MKYSLRTAAVAAVILSVVMPLHAEKKAIKLMSTVKEGKYDATDQISAAKLAYLPIPGTKEDYVIFQSIGKVSTLVIGRFASGEKEIFYISDTNGDGKVDEGTTYFPDIKKFRAVAQVAQQYTPEKFKQMKLDVINGVRGELNPNQEGVSYIKKNVEKRSDIVKKTRYKNGFRVFINDPDDQNLHRAIFYYSNNKKSTGGADLAFKVEYRNVGTQMISPIINYNVYCKDSDDPVVAEVVDDLSKFTAQYFGE